MAILGAAPNRFHQYCDQVRREFCNYSEEIYIVGRVVFLENLLKSEKIFLTRKLSQLLEKQSVENISREIQRLKNNKY